MKHYFNLLVLLFIGSLYSSINGQVESTLESDELLFKDQLLGLSGTSYRYDGITIGNADLQSMDININSMFMGNIGGNFSLVPGLLKMDAGGDHELSFNPPDIRFTTSLGASDYQTWHVYGDESSFAIQYERAEVCCGAFFGIPFEIDGSNMNIGINSPSITRANVHILQSGGGEEALILENDGDGSDLYGFEIGTNDLHILYDSNNDGIGVDLAELDSGSGLWFANSDIRMKTNIQAMENGVLDRVKQLNAVSYQFNHSKENQKQQIGFIAQDVQKLFPELVKESEKGILRLNYGQFSVLAIKAIQEQQIEMEKRDQEIEALKVQVEKLTKLVETRLAGQK